MGKAKGFAEDELARGYGGIERALRKKNVKEAVRIGRKMSARAEELKDYHTYHDLKLRTDALDAGCWNGKSYFIDSIDTRTFLRKQGDTRSPEAYVRDKMGVDEGAFGDSDSVWVGARNYTRSVISIGFIVAGVIGLRVSITGNVVGSVFSGGLSLSVLFLVLGILGLYLQIRKRG
ncbi:MAG: hypothetical protein KJ592_03440 [Nanoarchaeota archaeon]|nr:hypothetical protein [Nanoarchaeota archaeon]